MKITIKIEGMMCPHCEARVKAILEGVDGVTEATASHKDGCAVVTANDNVSVDYLRELIEKDGYKVIE